MPPIDPLDRIDTPTLAEQIEPYRKYGDTELALSLLYFEKCNAGPSLNTPAATGFTYHCAECEENVRAVSRPRGELLACPLCGVFPGARILGEGPKQN